VDDDIPYLLLTPGPLTTSRSVRAAMQRDYCTWDDEYNAIVSDIRRRIVKLATARDDCTSVLMQGSGTFAVEATLGSVVPAEGKLLVVNNGAYGKRMAQIAERLRIPFIEVVFAETEQADPAWIETALAANRAVTHVAMVHCETTTGMLNAAEAVGQVAARHGKTYIVDCMSSFGGIPLSMEGLGADFLVSSANKCIQGVPGFGIIIARRKELEKCQGRARSLSLDLFDQWHEMETKGGKWRYTSPTHAVRAFAQALDELDHEGGVAARHARYCENHRLLVEGMQRIGFAPLLAAELRSPIITSFLYPGAPRFSFAEFYAALKARRFVIYPGKVSHAPTFRIGTIGHVFPDDIRALIRAVTDVVGELTPSAGHEPGDAPDQGRLGRWPTIRTRAPIPEQWLPFVMPAKPHILLHMTDETSLPRSPELMSRSDSGLLVVDVQEKLMRLVAGQRRIIWNIRRLIDGAQILGLPVGATEQYPKGLGPTVMELASRLGPIADKVAFSCGGCPQVIRDLQARGVDKLLVVGIETHVCVLQTVFDLMLAGLRVYVAVDAVGSRYALDSETALRRMDSAGATLTTTETALFEWCQTAAAPEFKQISSLIQETEPQP